MTNLRSKIDRCNSYRDRNIRKLEPIKGEFYIVGKESQQKKDETAQKGSRISNKNRGINFILIAYQRKITKRMVRSF